MTVTTGDLNTTKTGTAKTVESNESGKDLYPLRRNASLPAETDPNKQAKEIDRQTRMKLSCERQVAKTVKRNMLIQVLMSAMKKAGCQVNIRRHISCENCVDKCYGGYDAINNQVVVCQNIRFSRKRMDDVLTHEMIHMFDYCKAEFDYTNIDHVACSEIRASNLSRECSMTSSFMAGNSTLRNFKGTHGECVKSNAIRSLMAVKNVDEEKASEAVNRVFDRCYGDMEPIGRRVFYKRKDAKRVKSDAFYYGYAI